MISVVIPHMNQAAELDRCLTALMPQVREAGAEVIVVDNGSAEMPQEVAARHGVRLEREETPGPGPARNHGVTLAAGDVLAFIDADCVPGEGWLAAIGRAMGGGAEILGGDVRILHVDASRPTIWEAYESEFAYRMEHYIAPPGLHRHRQPRRDADRARRCRPLRRDRRGRGSRLGPARDGPRPCHRLGARHGRLPPGPGELRRARPQMGPAHGARFRDVARAALRARAVGGAHGGDGGLAAGHPAPGAALRPDRRRHGRQLRAMGGLAAIRAWRARRMAELVFAPSSDALHRRWREKA